MKRGLLLVVLLVVSLCTMGQKAPHWVNHRPKPDNETYEFRVGNGTGNSIAEAKTNALKQVMQEAGYSVTLPYISDNTDVRNLPQTYNLPINVVCSSCVSIIKKGPEQGKYQIYILCKVAKKGNIEYNWGRSVDCSRLEREPVISVINSMFIPGLGQFRKRNYTEGALTLLGEVALVGTGTLCYLKAQDKLDIMRSDNVGYTDFSSARTDYNRLRDASYVIWGTAAGLYVFNLIRAAYTDLKPPRDCISLCPIVLPENERVTPGLAVRVKF